MTGGNARAIPDAEIVRFLETQPDFLARHPALYLTLTPPARVHGERMADHMAAMLEASRRQNATLQEGVRRRRAGRSLGDRINQALLGLIRAADPLEWIETELAATLAIDSAQLLLGDAAEPGLLNDRDIVFRDHPTDASLHGPAADLVSRDVLIRIRPGFGPPGVLALGSRDGGLPGPGMEAKLALLASALEAALDRA
jgi:uncharacterized protein YigA (DUF484 family)